MGLWLFKLLQGTSCCMVPPPPPWRGVGTQWLFGLCQKPLQCFSICPWTAGEPNTEEGDEEGLSEVLVDGDWQLLFDIVVPEHSQKALSLLILLEDGSVDPPCQVILYLLAQKPRAGDSFHRVTTDGQRPNGFFLLLNCISVCGITWISS